MRDKLFDYFFKLAFKLNDAWKGYYTVNEILENATIYYRDCKLSKAIGTPIGSIKVLLQLFLEEIKEGNTEYEKEINTICTYICEY